MPKRMRDLPEDYEDNRRALARVIGERVRLRRDQLQFTQEQLRIKLELEQTYISRAQFSRVEKGEAMLTIAELITVSSVLGVSIEWLLFGDEGRSEG